MPLSHRKAAAAILWRDTARKVEAADALKVTASDLVGLGVIDEVVPEPVGGAHTNPAEAVRLLSPALSRAVQSLRATPPDLRLQQRHDRFRRLGLIGINGL